MPLITHPYYTNCTDLEVNYYIDEESYHEENFLFSDLFMKKNLFPKLKNLKIKCIHNNSTSEKNSLPLPAIELQYLFGSSYLKHIETLEIFNTFLFTSWNSLILLSGSAFPSLRSLKLPLHSLANISTKLNKNWNLFLGNIDIKIFIETTEITFYNETFYREIFRFWIGKPQLIAKDIMALNNGRSLCIDMSHKYSNVLLGSLKKFDKFRDYLVENKHYMKKIMTLTKIQIESWSVSDDFLEYI